MDSAALVFTSDFYLALAIGRTVKDYFEIGLQAVAVSMSISRPQEEMKSFVLLTVKGNHDGRVFYAETVSDWPKNAWNMSRQKRGQEEIFSEFLEAI